MWVWWGEGLTCFAVAGVAGTTRKTRTARIGIGTTRAGGEASGGSTADTAHFAGIV